MTEPESNLTVVAQSLATAWQDVLRIPQIDPGADFLSLGGDSVQAGQVVARVRDRLGIELPLHLFVTRTSFGVLAREIERRVERRIAAEEDTRQITKENSTEESAEERASRKEWPSPHRLPRNRPLPLAAPQRRLWYLDQLHRRDDNGNQKWTATGETGDSSYNMAVAVRFEGTFDSLALQRSLDEIVRRHEVLRTRLIAIDGTPWQRIDAPRPVPIEVVDLTGTPATIRSRCGQEQAEARLRQPFDLAQDLMLRAVDLQFDDKDHLVVLIMHHIASDGWSIGIVLRELAALYAAFTQQPESMSPLPDLELQYADMAHWQEAAVARRENQLLNFWRHELAGAPQTLELPLDHPRPTRLTDRGAVAGFSLDNRQRTGLKTLSYNTETTLFNTLVAAFGVLLLRLTGQGDVLLSVPAANRLHPASEPLIGFFTNMLVIRLRMDATQDFTRLLSETHRVCCNALQHQDLPFDRLVADLQPDRQQGQTPFVQNGFALQNAFGPGTTLPGLEVESLPIHTGISHFDLSLSMAEMLDGIEGSIEYRTELFDATTISRWAASFQVVIDSILAGTTRPIGDLPTLSPASRHQLLVEWNATQQAFDRECCIHHLVQAQAARTPHAVCVHFADQFLTFKQLEEQANRLAWRLRALGVDREVTVGVLLERSLELPTTLLAVLKAGGACVPLAPDLPPQRLGLILEDTAAAIVATTDDLKHHLAADFKGVIFDVREPQVEVDGVMAEEESAPPLSTIGPSNLAYVIYTSGSTGRPKGVRMHHLGLCQRLFWQQDAYPLTARDRVLQNLSIGFDAAFWQVFGPLIAGASMVLPRPDGHMDTTYLAELIATAGVTCADFVPSVLSQLLEEPAITRCSALRQIVSGGEALHVSLARRIFEQLPAVHLVNIFGPTEVSLTISTKDCRPRDGELAVTIGRPISNITAYVLDQLSHPVAVGIVGEVYAGGLGLTGGYLARPALTAERFVPNPFGVDGARLYKTGDLARRRTDGELDFVGRVDHQVKIRGVRMELGEIEAKLARQDGVLEAAVLARDDLPGARPGEKRLVAYVVLSDASMTSAALRRGLSQQLPAPMVPGVYVVLPSMPLSVNGKIHRATLPTPDARAIRRRPTPPRNGLELELAQIWSQSLNLDDISIHDNFFDLGGHSLLAVRLMAAVQQHFGIDLDLAALYACGSVAEMADLLRAKRETDLPSNLVTLRAGSGLPLFCVHAVDGTATPYTALARAVGGDYLVYGIQAPGLEDDRSPPERFEDLAALYLQAITEVWPDGPHILCGWSAGGLLASEIARQMEGAGHDVSVVILLDTHPAADRDVHQTDTRDQERVMFAHQWLGGTEEELRESLNLISDAPAEYEDERQEDDEDFLDRLAVLTARREVLPANGGRLLLARRWRVFRHLFPASYRHKPLPHGCRVVSIRAEDTPQELIAGQERDCRDLTRGEFSSHAVSGDHHQLLRPPNVVSVARLIDRIMTGSDVGNSE